MKKIKTAWQVGNKVIEFDEQEQVLRIVGDDQSTVTFNDKDEIAEFMSGIQQIRTEILPMSTKLEQIPSKATKNNKVPIVRGLSTKTIDVWIKILRYIHKHPGATRSEICSESPSFSKYHKRMYERGLIIRTYQKRDTDIHPGRGNMIFHISKPGLTWIKAKEK